MANPKQIVKIARWARIRQAAIYILILCLTLGLIYPAFADGFSSVYPFVNGVFIGLFGGIIIFLLEYYVFHNSNKRLNFIPLVVVKVVTYSIVFTLLVITVVMISRGIQYNHHGFIEMYNGPEFRHFLYQEDLKVILSYTLLFTVIIIFTKEISKKLGREVLTNFITGKYYHPVREERIFMFLDLKDSTTIAENLNVLEFHNFVNRFFKDITESILFTKGEVYQYVGDEIVISWTMKKGIREANCIYMYLYALQAIEKGSKYYLDHFGIVPQFKAALHCGHVIRGEVGDIKSEIVFHGDVMNTTSRIEGLCNKLDEALLVSSDLYQNFPLLVRDQFILKGDFELKGKENKMKVYALKDSTISYLRSID